MAHEYFFEHHRLEAKRNRARLRLALAVLAVVGVCVPAVIIRAASSTTTDLDGAIILNIGSGARGSTTTGDFASATVTARRVSTGTSLTSTGNPFNFSELPAAAAGDHYIVSVSPATAGGYTVKGLTWCMDECTGYDPQTTNFRSGSSTDFTFSATHTYRMRWIYEPVTKLTSTTRPVSISPPKPAVALVPPSTPTPLAPDAQVLTATFPAPGSDLSDKTPPTVPGNFQALSSGTNAIIQLSWTAATDVVGVKAYRLERSLDQSSWTVAGASITSLTFTDDTVAFGVLYYYRLSAADLSGNTSGFANVVARTGDFAVNSKSSDPGTYSSSDEVAAVDVPAGTFPENARCTVELSPGGQLTSAGRTAVAGPYVLICKNVGGEVLDEYARPVNWSFALKSKLKGSPKLVVVSRDSSGVIADVTTANYDSKTQTMRFSQASATTTAVLAVVSQSAGPSASIFVIVAAVLLLIAGVLVLVLRKFQRQSYSNYLRSKYYNL